MRPVHRALVLGASLLLAVPGLFSTALAEGELPAVLQRFSARAYDPGTGRPLYSERHEVQLRGGRPVREEVVYYGPGGKVIARKWLRYGDDPSAPSFRFEDYRTGRVESARRGAKGWLVTHREGRDAEIERQRLKAGARFVVDEGYRMLLQAQLERLVRGGSLVAEAVVASRTASYGMRFSGRGTITRGTGERLLRVHLEMDNLLLRLVGPSADLLFDMKTRRLVEFVGLANIRDDDGQPQQARVVYSYGR